MFQFFFAWIRKQTRAAVLAGLSDAAAELTDGGEMEQAAAQLRQRLEPLPPPPSPEAEANGQPEPAVAGRRRKGGEG